MSPERVSLLASLLDGAIPSNEQAQLLALRGLWRGFIGQVDVGKKVRKAPGAVCTVSQGLTTSDMPNTRFIAKEALNHKNERVVLFQEKDAAKVLVPPKGSAGYGFEFAMWTKTRDREVFDIFNQLITELLVFDVDYLSLVTHSPFVLIDQVACGPQRWALMLSLPPPSSPLHGIHSLQNGTFQFIQASIITSEEHFAACCLPDAGDIPALLEAGPRGLTDRSRNSVIAFNPKSHPVSMDHLRQAVFENDALGVEKWIEGTLALKPQEFKQETLLEGGCHRDHPLVLACRNGRNPTIFKTLIEATPKLPILRSRFRSSRAPSRLAHVYFEAITQDQPVIVKELLRPDAELKVDVDVRCPAQQETGLHLACLNRASVEIVNILLEHKADVEAKMDGEATCLISAAQTGSTEVLKLLLAHAQRTLSADAFKTLLDARESKGATALMLAALCDQPTCVELLLANGADESLSLQGPADVLTAKDFAKMGNSKASFALLGGFCSCVYICPLCVRKRARARRRNAYSRVNNSSRVRIPRIPIELVQLLVVQRKKKLHTIIGSSPSSLGALTLLTHRGILGARYFRSSDTLNS